MKTLFRLSLLLVLALTLNVANAQLTNSTFTKASANAGRVSNDFVGIWNYEMKDEKILFTEGNVTHDLGKPESIETIEEKDVTHTYYRMKDLDIIYSTFIDGRSEVLVMYEQKVIKFFN